MPIEQAVTTPTQVEWISQLSTIVTRSPIVLLRFSSEQWDQLMESRSGTEQFTYAVPHVRKPAPRVPTICLLVFMNHDGGQEIRFGVLRTRTAVSTLHSRLSVAAAGPIRPASETDLWESMADGALKAVLARQLSSNESVVSLSPAVSAHLLKRLADDEANHQTMREALAYLEKPKRFSGNHELQLDAIGSALRAFGLSPDAPAFSVDVHQEGQSALRWTRVHEDAVIEHDARSVPGFQLESSDCTGRAVFRNRGETLQIITANKRPLEQVFGVDLIYLNVSKKNLVMVQYKMLEHETDDSNTDWIYRPDGQFNEELRRMRAFSGARLPGQHEYRVNPQAFYLRFVRRDACLAKGTITIPIDHFQVLSGDPAFKGPKGAFRISYDTLDGRYLRQDAFLDLVSAGYIGAYAQGTEDLTTLIEETLAGNRAVVAAVQMATRAVP